MYLHERILDEQPEFAPDVEPRALLVEVWIAKPREMALMAMVDMVAVMRLALRFFKWSAMSF